MQPSRLHQKGVIMAIIKSVVNRLRHPVGAAGLALAVTAVAYTGFASIAGNTQAPSAFSGLKLTDAKGRDFDFSSLSGQPVAVFFGFTYCPDVCPMTLHRLGFLRQKIGPDFDRIKIVFVSLDPQRDTPEVLKNYMEGQPVRVTGLTGTEADIAKMAKRFDVFHEVIRVPGQDYTIDHTASIFLVDKKGRRSGEITMDADESEYEKKLRQLLQGPTNFYPKNQI